METVLVGRLPKIEKIEVPEGTSVRDALARGGFTPQADDSIQEINGTRYEGHESVVAGKTYLLTENLKSGC